MKVLINQLIIDQTFEFIIMIFAGMTVMLSFDIYTIIKNKTKPSDSISFIQDILFWLYASILTASFLYYSSYGKLSFHALIAFGVGAALWRKFFCDIIGGR